MKAATTGADVLDLYVGLDVLGAHPATGTPLFGAALLQRDDQMLSCWSWALEVDARAAFVEASAEVRARWAAAIGPWSHQDRTACPDAETQIMAELAKHAAHVLCIVPTWAEQAVLARIMPQLCAGYCREPLCLDGVQRLSELRYADRPSYQLASHESAPGSPLERLQQAAKAWRQFRVRALVPPARTSEGPIL